MLKMGIYKLTNKINNKFYIGKSINLKNRINTHKCGKEQYLLGRSIRKYGWENFEIEILAEFNKIDNLELLALETAFIEYFNSTNKEIGYNICLFSNDRTGTKLSDETKQKISINRIGKYTKENHPNYGKPMSKEQKQLISKANLGRIHSEQSKKNMSEAHCGAKCYLWGTHRSEEIKNKIREKRKLQNMSSHKKPIHQIDKNNGNIIQIWDSARNAGKALNINEASISGVCRKDKYCHSAGGFKWEYV